ncbi:MAG TPA: histidine phosphatase family protein [Candidatus Binatia bacterium]|nr:histidine phosphatase family protein [Candidatus Binatia bacterium]
MQVFLVRHGATDWNLQGRCQGATDLDLNEVGVRQAEQIAASLTNETIHGIYSSNLKRAQQTARFFSLHHHLPVLIENDVRELDHGELEGLTFGQIRANYSQFIQKWRTEPAEIQVPGGERLVDVARRAWKGLNRIVQRHAAEEAVVVVSHNFPIISIICRITGTHLNNYRTFHLDPCGVTRLSRNRAEHWQVTHVNNKEYAPETTVLP